MTAISDWRCVCVAGAVVPGVWQDGCGHMISGCRVRDAWRYVLWMFTGAEWRKGAKCAAVGYFDSADAAREAANNGR